MDDEKWDFVGSGAFYPPFMCASLSKCRPEYAAHLSLAQKEWEASLHQHTEKRYVCDIIFSTKTFQGLPIVILQNEAC